jgi:3-deoxy-7-phosphoheptulonate synthase
MATNTRCAPQILTAPTVLKRQLPIPTNIMENICIWRTTIMQILKGEDARLLVIIGPCSVHDPVAVLDYARKLERLSRECPHIFFVMRTYFEKPRTRKGWSGFMHDPNLDGSNNMQQGIIASRKLLIDIAKIGIPCATETLSLIAPQYLDDLLCFACIGARTTESQPHRELASGLSVPVGFKNSTSGSVAAAINSIHSAAEPKVFMGVNENGSVAAIHTKGNPNSCLVLRGAEQPNYQLEICEQVVQILDRDTKNVGIVVDASHGNSGKDWQVQMEVIKYLATHKHPRVRGIMIESFLNSGNQSINNKPLKYGVSVTDACIDWINTTHLLKLIEKHHKY